MQTRFQFVKVLVLVLLIGTMSLFFFTIGFADATASEDSTAAPAAVPTAPPLHTYVSTSSSGSAGAVSFNDEDIIRYNSVTGTWEMFFDGSDVGVGSNNVDSFQLKQETSVSASGLGFVILMSFKKDFKNLAGLGKVQSCDIVKFTPTSVGNTTAGTFSFFKTCTEMGLNNDANIDTFTFDPTGRLVVSTAKTAQVSGLMARREDLIVWNGSAWQLYLDGSAFGLTTSNENINGAWIDPTGDKNIYLATKGSFSAVSGATSISGDSDDIFGVSPSGATLPITAGFLFPSFNGDTVGLNKNLDGFFIDVAGTIGTVVTLDSISAAAADDAAVVQYEVSSDEVDATDSEMDEADAAEAQNNRLFVPVVFAR